MCDQHDIDSGPDKTMSKKIVRTRVIICKFDTIDQVLFEKLICFEASVYKYK